MPCGPLGGEAPALVSNFQTALLNVILISGNKFEFEVSQTLCVQDDKIAFAASKRAAL